jgi:hypothetical protein
MSRVTEIRHVGYGVIDFEAERRFYTADWGLEETSRRDGTAWFRAPGHDEPNVLRLRQSDANHLDVIALATASRSDVDVLHARLL